MKWSPDGCKLAICQADKQVSSFRPCSHCSVFVSLFVFDDEESSLFKLLRFQIDTLLIRLGVYAAKGKYDASNPISRQIVSFKEYRRIRMYLYLVFTLKMERIQYVPYSKVYVFVHSNSSVFEAYQCERKCKTNRFSFVFF